MDAWDEDKPDVWKVRENKVRRIAERRGYKLEKKRRLDRQAIDYRTYSLSSSHAATANTTSPQGATLSEVETFLNVKGTTSGENQS